MAANTDLLFRHKAKVGVNEGQLRVTAAFISFIPADQKVESSHWPWSSIADTKYSPLDDPKQRCMLRLLFVAAASTNASGGGGAGAAGGAAVTVQLLGAEVSSCQTELVKLKAVVSSLRSNTNNSNSNIYLHRHHLNLLPYQDQDQDTRPP